MAEIPSGQDKTEKKSFRGREQYWHGHYCRWEQSGLSLAGYARSQGLNVNTFYGWHDRLKKRGLAKPEPPIPIFHRVAVKHAEPPPVKVGEVVSLKFSLLNGIGCEVALSLADCAGFMEKLSRLRP